MKFWGVEVKAGEPLKVQPDPESIIHLSQAALGESKKEKGNESVPLFLKIDDKKIVLGTLSPENIPQLSFDLVFEREVELSHNWKYGSVHLCGYQTALPEEEEMYSDEDSEDEEPLHLINADNGKVQPLVETAKPAAGKPKPDSSAKQKAKPAEQSKGNKEDESDGDDESDSDDSEDESDDEEESEEGMSVDEDSEDEDGSGSEEETPKKAEKGKKRPNDSATKTPVPSKKIKSVTPQKTDGKKGGHTATPHPAKGAGKTAANGSNVKSPKSGGQFSCKSCDRAFGSDAALQSHSKAKHGGK